MKKLGFLPLLFAFALVLVLPGCPVPGKIKFKQIGGEWDAYEIEVERDNITPKEIKKLKDRLNGK